MDKLELAKVNARKIVVDTCAVKAGESVIIVTDSEAAPLMAKALFDASLEIGAVPVTITMPKIKPGESLPDIVNAALMEADVIITPTTTSIYHTEGIRIACLDGKPARLQALSEWQEDTFLNGGITADFVGLKPLVETVGKYFDKGRKIRFTTPAGTDLTASIENRPADLNTGLADKPGVKMGIPTIEVFCAPVEESVNGVIVVDAMCSGGVGVIKEEPIRITVKDGKAVKFSDGPESKRLQRILEAAGTDSVYQIAEMAIGLNPKCRITGNINEDEGKYGTCHCALGSNTGFGGINSAPLHIDMVQYNPTIIIDGDVITKDGILQIADMTPFL